MRKLSGTSTQQICHAVVKSLRGAGSLKFKKKIESQNEITVVGEFKTNDNEFVNIATSFYYQQRQQPHAMKSFNKAVSRTTLGL